MLAWVDQHGLPLLAWHGPPGVVAAFSGRQGGVSGPPFASLNVGMRSGDDRALVRENRRRLCAAVGADPARTSSCYQVHSATVHRAGPLPPGGDFLSGTAEPPIGDALHTDEPGRALVAFAADCVPIALARADGSAVAVCHAGWRGLAAGVVEATVAALGAGPMQAAIGPCAGPERYEVGEEVAAGLIARFGETAVRDGHADLAGCAALALRASGTVEVETAGICTIGDAERFFSHRRDGAPGGRQAVIAFREAA